MTMSTEQKQSHIRRKHRWIGGVTLVALSLLILPWLLTPQFESIRETRPQLSKLPDPPQIQVSRASKSIISQTEIEASREKLHTLIEAQVGNENTASYVIQVSAFENEKYAKALAKKLETLEIGRTYLRKEAKLTKVYVGPFLTRKSADSAQIKINQRLSVSSQVKQYNVREHGNYE